MTASGKKEVPTRLSAEDALEADEWRAQKAHLQRLRTWTNNFEATRPGKSALIELEQLFPPGQETDPIRICFPLRDRVLDSCYRASIFSPTTDPHQAVRREKKTVLGEIKPQQRAIATLRRFLVKRGTATSAIRRRTASTAFGDAILDQKRNGISITQPDNGSLNRADMLDRILEVYSVALEAAIHSTTAGGQVAHPCSYGCLRYPKPLDHRKRQADVETMLLFDLVMTFRIQSQKGDNLKHGQKMPKKKGKPHYPLAADFVIATFDRVKTTRKPKTRESLTSSLKNLIKDNPELTFAGWQRSQDKR